MRVLHVLNDARDVGNGINNVTVDLACAQVALGHDVALASAGGEFVEFLAARGVAHHLLPQRPRGPLASVGLLRALAAAVRAQRPDVVHSHNLIGTVAAALVQPLVAVRAGPRQRRRRYRTAATVHLEAKRGVALVWLAGRVLFFSDAARSRLRSRLPGRLVPSARSAVVLQGPLGGARALARAGRAAPQLPPASVVTVCGLYRHKGIFDLVDAFALLAASGHPAQLHVVGAGPEREALAAAVERAGLGGRVHLVGFVADPGPWMAAADAFVLASRSDPAALVLAEVRAAGTPIITTDLPGSLTLVEGGAAALVVPPADPVAMADAVRRVLDEPELGAGLVARGSQGLEELAMTRYARDVVGVYEDLLRR